MGIETSCVPGEADVLPGGQLDWTCLWVSPDDTEHICLLTAGPQVQEVLALCALVRRRHQWVWSVAAVGELPLLLEKAVGAQQCRQSCGRSFFSSRRCGNDFFHVPVDHQM
ncbi:Hypothetical predicted protein [Marmota monax]|uniref:Uncharacterized protein n=1 Tax=Marmota monax TaxID=9995 RepID=A0A5E4AEW6_MARMO|nr:hypothetical protein GHT09_000215 [Marmota monax]VTJ55927.1 Hypothetical predicted protein [Marmota monax]